MTLSLIKELEKQATIEVPSHDCWGAYEPYHRLDHVKFATLIVQECIDIAERCGELSSWTAAAEIQKRFDELS